MALQGTLDTFALPDVLRLLAATNKTGRLQIRGDRGAGEVWLDQGNVVGGTAEALTFDTSDIVFELLRHNEGSFEFIADEQAPEGHEPVDVDEVIHQAQDKLAEWLDVEKVVPSMECLVSLVEDLPEDEVTLNRERWHTLLAIGEGRTVSELDRRLELGEIRVSKAVRILADDGLVTVGEDPAAPADLPAPPSESVTDSDDISDHDLVDLLAQSPETNGVSETNELRADAEHDLDEAVRAEIDSPDDGSGDGLGGSRDVDLDASLDASSTDHAYLSADEGAADQNWPLPEPLPAAGEPIAESGIDPFVHPPEPTQSEADPGQAEMTQHLSQLSPSAAQAIAAAAASQPGDDLDEASHSATEKKRQKDAGKPEEPMNRSLLSKFISSK